MRVISRQIRPMVFYAMSPVDIANDELLVLGHIYAERSVHIIKQGDFPFLCMEPLKLHKTSFA
jgi:hypothetical protein